MKIYTCVARLLGAGAVLLTVACGSQDEGGPRADCTTDPALSCEPQPVEGSRCDAETQAHPDEGAEHVATGTEVVYGSNPPASGAHYGSWADYDVYESPVPRGNWIHSMEHGAVVVLYACEDCADQVSEAAAWIDSLPLDPSCVALGGTRRVILTPDPLLDVPWAAASWTFTLKSDCFEPDVFRAFFDEHYGEGREDLCNAGIDPTTE